MAKNKTASPALFPMQDTPALSGLARAAAQAPLDSTGCLTEYRPLVSRSILNRTASRRGLPFTHAINPYRGCEFACRYCYARYTHEFLELHDPADFEHKIYFKQNAAWLLEQELRSIKPGTEIAFGTATDPYQPIERRNRVTRSLLQVFARHSGLRLGLITKSTLIARDLDLLRQVAASNALTIHITVTTTDTHLARLLEPRAPRPDLRLRTLARLRQAGIRAGILCSPLMPGINDTRSSIAAVGKAAAEAGASFLAAGALFLKPCSQPTFFRFVEENFPAHVAAYQRRYAESAFATPEYRKRVAEIVAAVCHEHKLGHRFSDQPTGGAMPAHPQSLVAIQPWLPFTQK